MNKFLKLFIIFSFYLLEIFSFFDPFDDDFFNRLNKRITSFEERFEKESINNKKNFENGDVSIARSFNLNFELIEKDDYVEIICEFPEVSKDDLSKIDAYYEGDSIVINLNGKNLALKGLIKADGYMIQSSFNSKKVDEREGRNSQSIINQSSQQTNYFRKNVEIEKADFDLNLSNSTLSIKIPCSEKQKSKKIALKISQ